MNTNIYLPSAVLSSNYFKIL